jgi:hypothetical protein
MRSHRLVRVPEWFAGRECVEYNAVAGCVAHPGADEHERYVPCVRGGSHRHPALAQSANNHARPLETRGRRRYNIANTLPKITRA